MLQSSPNMINDAILDLIPHRPPFLMVDRIIDFEPDRRVVGMKNITINEPFFQGHFTSYPLMPNSLIIEALAQTASALFFKNPKYAGQLPLYSGIDHFSVKKSVVPGDQLRLEAELIVRKEPNLVVEVRALVDSQVVCEGEMTFTFAAPPSRPQIHPTASVHMSAILGADVVIGPFSIVGENVVIGDRTVLEAHVMVERDTEIGEECRIHFGAVIGSKAQDIKYKGELTKVIIGDRNEIREYVTINRATGQHNATVIGSDNLLMTNVHVGHNCVLGNKIVIVNNSNLAGHVIVEDNVIIGGMTGVHQFVRIGKSAMVGSYTRLLQDMPPFMLCEGNPAIVRNINAVGLKRSGLSREAIREVRIIFKELFRSGKNFTQAMETISQMDIQSDQAKYLIAFCTADSHRGLAFKKPEETSEANDEE